MGDSDQKTNRQNLYLGLCREENNLSNLANCCEYLTSEKLCLAVSDSEKAKAIRQVRCKNEEKMSCCYLCMLVLDCATPCRFLGKAEHDPQQIERENNQINSALIIEEKLEEEKTKNVPANCCSLCNVEMSQTRTNLRIDGWGESNKKPTNENSARESEEVLPVLIYLCPKCGKIDLRADES